jgi:hypothetical protein
MPISATVTVTDNVPFQFWLKFKTEYATAGTAWFDNLVITAPSGQPVQYLGDGTFDHRDRIDRDSALWSEVYSLYYGDNAASFVDKPLVRGETGISVLPDGQEYTQLVSDTHGVWLHNLEWAELNPGGMYDLYWWTENIVANNLYFQFVQPNLLLHSIPLDNGHYVDAAATASISTTRTIGQKDLTNERAHLWLYDSSYTWWNVVNGIPYVKPTGSITMTGFTPSATYSTTWWTFNLTGTCTQVPGTVTADGSGNLVLNLAAQGWPGDTTDAAVKIGDYTAAFKKVIP